MRKLLTIVVICATITFLSACTNNIEEEVKTTETPAETSLPNESTAPTDASSDLLKYQSKDGWSLYYPTVWDFTSDDSLKDTESEKYISFETIDIPSEGSESWLDTRIDELLAPNGESENTMLEELTEESKDGLTIYKYAIKSNYMDTLSEMRFIIYVDDARIYEFHGQIPPLTKEEFENIVETFTFEK